MFRNVRLYSFSNPWPETEEALSEAHIETATDHLAFEIPRDLLANPCNNDSASGRSGPSLDGGWDGPPGAVTGVVSEVIRSGFGSRVPDLRETAELAGVGVRTLQRSLKSEGVHFRELVDRARFEKARTLLADGQILLKEIAHHLGYPDAANFTHAFRRWTGASPLEFRARGGA